MTGSDADISDPRMLARMFELGTGHERIWDPDELGPILRHQLSAPAQFDLEGMDGALAGRLRARCAEQGLLIGSFNDLFHHPSPPLELLEMTKEFGKACRNHPDSLLPHEIGTLLYMTSIVVALLRCGRRITGQGDASLRQSIQWLMYQPWVDEGIRLILGEGLARLDPTGSDGT